MSGVLFLLWAIALVVAFAAIVLGRNLTRSIVAGIVSIAILEFVLLAMGAAYLSLVIAIPGVLALALLQLFGWMLVDVDRDHLPSTDWPTWLARGLAFFLVGGGLAVLLTAIILRGELVVAEPEVRLVGPSEVGLFLFGTSGEVAILFGMTIAASLLACLFLLRRDGD